jgi:hypothetical protein
VRGVLFTLGLQVSCHSLVATALRIELHGRRSDNKLNVVALGNVVVTKPNPAALYTPTLGVLGDLQVRKDTAAVEAAMCQRAQRCGDVCKAVGHRRCCSSAVEVRR